MIDLGLILQLGIGGGIIGSLWKLNSQVATLITKVDYYEKVSEDHENRLRSLEDKE